MLVLFWKKKGRAMNKILLAIISTLLIQACTCSALAADSKTPATIAEAFLARLGKGEGGPAYDELFSNSAIALPPLQLDALKR
jgi:hypothetical protein